MGAEDITKPNTLVNVHENDEGTGIYWLVDSSGQYEQVFVSRITKARARELADDFYKAGKQTLDAFR
jgi:hypothetical protein